MYICISSTFRFCTSPNISHIRFHANYCNPKNVDTTQECVNHSKHQPCLRKHNSFALIKPPLGMYNIHCICMDATRIGYHRSGYHRLLPARRDHTPRMGARKRYSVYVTDNNIILILIHAPGVRDYVATTYIQRLNPWFWNLRGVSEVWG